METYETRNGITLSQFMWTFLLFTLLMTAALMVPEAPQIIEHHRAVYTIEALVYYRAIYTIWVTIIFMVPALALHFLPGDSPSKTNYWKLFWTFGFVAFMVHFYYTIGVIFHGSLGEVYAAQGPVIATSNLLDAAWWGFDLILAWFVHSNAKWIRIQRHLAHLYIPLTFFVSAVIIKHGVVRWLGIVMTVVLLLSILLRWICGKKD